MEVGISSFCSSGLLIPIVFTLLHLLGGCCPAQGVDLLFVCCGLMRTESNRDAWSPSPTRGGGLFSSHSVAAGTWVSADIDVSPVVSWGITIAPVILVFWTSVGRA